MNTTATILALVSLAVALYSILITVRGTYRTGRHNAWMVGNVAQRAALEARHAYLRA